MIDAPIHIGPGLRLRRRRHEIVDAICGTSIAVGKQMEVRPHCRVDLACRNHRQRRVEVGEIQFPQTGHLVPLVLGGDGRLRCRKPNNAPLLFEIRKKEGLVFPDGPTNTATEGVLAVLRLLDNPRRGEEIARIEDVVPEVLVQRAMKLAAAALGNDVDHRARRTTISGTVGTGVYFHFGDAIDRGPDTAQTEIALIVVEAIAHLIVERIIVPVADDHEGLPALLRIEYVPKETSRPCGYSWLNLDSDLKTPSVQRQILNCLVLDRASHGRAIRL